MEKSVKNEATGNDNFFFNFISSNDGLRIGQFVPRCRALALSEASRLKKKQFLAHFWLIFFLIIPELQKQSQNFVKNLGKF